MASCSLRSALQLLFEHGTGGRGGGVHLPRGHCPEPAGAFRHRQGGVWKACLLSGLLFGAAHLTNLLSSAPFGVLMQCVFAASLGTLFAAIYFRTGNLWVTVFLHGAMDIASMLVGGLYGTEDVAESISGYDASMMLSILIYLIPTLFLLRKKKIGEVALYFGRDCAPAAAPAPEENGERLR
mgnify:CR=1 FL=1